MSGFANRLLSGAIARATIQTSAVLGFRLLAQALALVLIARMLGPEAMGLYAGLAAFAFLLGTLATFGSNFVILAEVSRNPLGAPSALCYAPVVVAGAAIVLAATYVVTAAIWVGSHPIALSTLVAIALNEVLISPLMLLIATPHQGRGRIAFSQVLVTIPAAGRALVAGGVMSIGAADPLLAFVWGVLAFNILAVALAALYSARGTSIRPYVRTLRFPRLSELRQMSSFAVLNITAMGPPEIDKMLALHLLPTDSAGFYSTSSRIVGATSMPVIAMMLAALPRLFRRDAETTTARRRLLKWILLASAGYGVLLAGLLWAAAPFLASLLGAQYLGTTVVIGWLAWTVPGLLLRIAGGTALMALGQPWARAATELAGILMLIGMGTLMTSNWGSVGMVAAVGITELSMAAVAWGLVWRSTKPSGVQC